MALLYLIDANVLITAHNTYYPIDRVPEFWEWLAEKAKSGDIKMPLETYEEAKSGGEDGDTDLC
jgi:predicted deacetylase